MSGDIYWLSNNKIAQDIKNNSYYNNKILYIYYEIWIICFFVILYKYFNIKIYLVISKVILFNKIKLLHLKKYKEILKH